MSVVLIFSTAYFTLNWRRCFLCNPMLRFVYMSKANMHIEAAREEVTEENIWAVGG